METSLNFIYPLESANYNLWRLRRISFEIKLPMWYIYTIRGFLVEKSIPPVGALIIYQFPKSLSFGVFHTSFFRRLFGMPFNDERARWVETVVRYGKPVFSLSIYYYYYYYYTLGETLRYSKKARRKKINVYKNH